MASSKFNHAPNAPKTPSVCRAPNPEDPPTDYPQLLKIIIQIHPEQGNQDSRYDQHVLLAYRTPATEPPNWYAASAPDEHLIDLWIQLSANLESAHVFIQHTDDAHQTLTWQWPAAPAPAKDNFYLDLPNKLDDQSVRTAKATIYP